MLKIILKVLIGAICDLNRSYMALFFLPIFTLFPGETWKCAYNSAFSTKRLKLNHRGDNLRNKSNPLCEVRTLSRTVDTYGSLDRHCSACLRKSDVHRFFAMPSRGCRSVCHQMHRLSLCPPLIGRWKDTL